jgi:hypothetical protein
MSKKDWDISGGIATNSSTLAFAVLGPFAGEPTKRYEAENTETGERHTVLASSKGEASRKAHEGKFEK